MKLTVDHSNFKHKYQNVVTLYSTWDHINPDNPAPLFMDKDCTEMVPGKLAVELFARNMVICVLDTTVLDDPYNNGHEYYIPTSYNYDVNEDKDITVVMKTSGGNLFISGPLFEGPSGRIYGNVFEADYDISVSGTTAVME